MRQRRYTGRNPSAKQLREADRIASLHPLQQRSHPSALAADPQKLTHINTYGSLPEYYSRSAQPWFRFAPGVTTYDTQPPDTLELAALWQSRRRP